MPRETGHIPVLLADVLDVLRPSPGNVIVDCTLGLGGHSIELLRHIGPEGKLIAMDMDGANLDIARARLAAIAPNFSLHHTNFAALPTVLAAEDINRVHAILADVGVSSPQIDDPARGFSYRNPGPLDMRMDPSRGRPASALVNGLSEKELRDALLQLGDEDDAPQIAHLIVERRSRKPIATTEDLTAIICEARGFTLKRAAGAKLHPAARTFQALRMLVNRELANLQRLLAVLPDHLHPGARAAIISFHSGEDRIVKHAFREGFENELYSKIARDPTVATEQEQRANPRSRSAKLRWAERAPLTEQTEAPPPPPSPSSPPPE